MTPRVACLGCFRDKPKFAPNLAKGVGTKVLPDDNLEIFSFTLALRNLGLLVELVKGDVSLKTTRALAQDLCKITASLILDRQAT